MKVSSILRSAPLLALAVLASPAKAQTVYAVDYDGADSILCRVDLATATATLIEHTGLTLEGLAYDAPSGKLYATGSNGTLYALATTGGIPPRIIGGTGVYGPESLAFGGSTLYRTGLNTSSKIYSVDPTTGATALSRTGSIATGSIHAMAFADDGSLAYVVADVAQAREALYSIAASGNEAESGLLTDVVQTAAIVNAGGNRLYALDISGNEYRLDAATGAETLVGNTGGQAWLDVTLAGPSPVPEPSALAGLGAAAMQARLMAPGRKQETSALARRVARSQSRAIVG